MRCQLQATVVVVVVVVYPYLWNMRLDGPPDFVWTLWRRGTSLNQPGGQYHNTVLVQSSADSLYRPRHPDSESVFLHLQGVGFPPLLMKSGFTVFRNPTTGLLTASLSSLLPLCSGKSQSSLTDHQRRL